MGCNTRISRDDHYYPPFSDSVWFVDSKTELTRVLLIVFEVNLDWRERAIRYLCLHVVPFVYGGRVDA